MYDENPKIRKWIAHQGYGLETFINDEDLEIRNIARELLRKRAKKL